MDIEKNYVDVSKLFDYKTVLVFDRGNGEEFKVYLRLIGDADYNRAKVLAIRDVSLLREKLEDPDWDERIAYIPSVKNKTKEELVELLALLNVREVGTRVTLETQSKPPFKNPSEPKPFAPIKDKENYQKEIDSFPQRVKAYIEDKIRKELDKIKENYSTKTREQLINIYERMIVEEICEARFKERISELIVFYSTFLDENYNIRLYNEFELNEFANLPTVVKERLIEAYSTIDLPGEELKKSQGAMR